MKKNPKNCGIRLENITKSFKNDIILDDISLEFYFNKIYGIVGRNASGKSVLFKIICGFLAPEHGKVIINGIDIYKEKSFPENVAALIEKPKFLDNLNGLENLKLLASVKRRVGADEIKKWLDIMSINPKDQKKDYRQCSVGTKQKLGIIQVLMEDDEILIFDEPFNGLDDKTVEQIRKLILKEKEKGKLILLSSHNREDIEILCDTVYRIDSSKVRQIDKE